ncbi:MAG: hypothetical protein CL816_03080 [Coxiellaceae bacterium]|nr:hypothetical protein [Coxiellaceae bacterium]|tara:strand:+ start:5712 stop:6071 length:360 start_codon:yes stop_codon:yes gene_type:complete
MHNSSLPIDWNNCLQRCNNNAALARDLLDMLAKELPRNKAAILKAHKNRSITEMQQNIHKLHGACACCGANTLQELLAKIEQELQNKPSPLSQGTLQSLIQEIDRTTEAILKGTYLPTT